MRNNAHADQVYVHTPEDEAARLVALRRYDILDTPPDGAFDRITAMAARLFSVPIAIISLVDQDRIWFKSRHGVDVEQIDRAPGLCASAILQTGPWVLSDAKRDVRSLANPLVAGEFGLRFYAGVPLRTGDGHHLGMLCVIDRAPREATDEQIEQLRDLAAIVMDQMELRLSARRAIAERDAKALRLTAVLAQSAVGISEAAPDGRFLTANDRLCAMLDRSRDEVLRLRIWDVTHPDDLTENMERTRHLIETGAPFSFDKRYVRPDGSIVWVNVNATCLLGEAGEVRGVFSVTADITERKRTQAALRNLNDTLGQKVEARTRERDQLWRVSRDLIAVAGWDGIYKSVNPAWTALLGYAEAELIGARFDHFVHPDECAQVRSVHEALTAGAPTAHCEIRVRARDDSYRWVQWLIVAEGDELYASGRDVTAGKELEEQLRQSQKMEAVGQLTGGIAHDFNNMLTVVMGSLDMLSRRMDGADARMRTYIDNAREGARRAAALTQRLLAFSRQQPLAPEPVDANRLITGMAGLLRGSLGVAVTVETVLADGLWPIHADPNQLENVVLNVAVNARDAMPEGGRLTIETRNVDLDPGVPGEYVLIAMSDTGCGMPAAVIARAFDPFFTTKEAGKGTGLGLSQVYGFITQSGGQVKLCSEPGQGTTVKVYLPRHDGDKLPKI